MAIPKAYMTSTKNLAGMLEAIKSAQAPKRFSIRFLESLDFKSTTDRLFIGVLKSLGFLTKESSAPTDRYFRFLDQTQSSIVLAEGIKDAYADLFQVRIDAHKMAKSEVVNKVKTLTRGEFSESVLSFTGMTFVALCKLADFKTKPAIATTEVAALAPNEQGKKLGDTVEDTENGYTPGKFRTLGGLHYNIQLILPESRDPKVYDALFRSLNKHLLRETD